MRSVSTRFLEETRGDHTAIARADLFDGATLVFADLPVVAGTITDDSQAMFRRRFTGQVACSVEVLDLLPTTVPEDGGLWPLGNELRIRGGVLYDDDTEELVDMGVFRVSRPSLADVGANLTLSLEGYDRSRAMSRNKFTDPYSIAAGVNYATAIKDLIKNRLPFLVDGDFNFMATTFTTPLLVFDHQDDPWDMAMKMAQSIGAELFFDGSGEPVLRPEPDPVFTPSSFDFVEGEEATVLGITRDLSDEEAYNGVLVIGETSGNAPVRATAWDTNPDSPTYYDPAIPGASKYGAVPWVVTSSYITTSAQAQAAANAELARVLGVLEHIDFNAINNPAMESGDVITLTRDRIHVDSAYILNSITMGLGSNTSMAGTTRKRRAS